MAEGIKTPPKFDDINFLIWKVKMSIFLQPLRSRVIKAVTKLFSAPDGDEGTWSEIITKEFDVNARHTIPYFKIFTFKSTSTISDDERDDHKDNEDFPPYEECKNDV